MSRPLKILSVSGSNISFKEMTDAEIYDAIIYHVLKEFASIDSAGSLVNPQGGATNIGTFIDTYRTYGVGDHVNAASVSSQSVTIAQLTSAVGESFIRPLCFKSGSIREMSDADMDTYIINPALDNMTLGGLGSYYLSAATPTHVAGATWALKFTIPNLTTTGTNAGDVYIWQMTNRTAPGSLYPLRWNSNIYEIPLATTRLLVQRLRNRILSTSKGTYVVQSSAPGTGTWAQLGSTYTDVRLATANQQYAGAYVGSYAGAYAGDYVGTYYPMYGASVGAEGYAGTYTGYYTGNYTGSYTGYYQGLTVQGTTENVSTAALWVRRS